MLSSPDPRVTKPLISGSEWPPETAKLPILTQSGQLTARPTSTKLPIVIPASTKRQRTAPLASPPRRKRHFILPGILLGSLLMVILASLFVVPLDNGQQSHTFVQTISNLIAPGQSNAINPLQHSAPPTPTTPPQMMNEGYCGGTDIWGTCATYNTESGVMGTGHMQRPVNGAIITQVFAHLEYQAWCGCWKPHTGIDLAAPFGSPIMAADSGQVIWTGWDWSGLGWAVKINHGNYIATIYGHLERFIVKVGQSVTKGQVIGYEGSTGASTGPHVHFMVLINNIWVDPAHYVQLP